MLTVNTVEALREHIMQWKQLGHTIGFVPTMGNLHTGHLSLVDRARQQADKVVVSIFVNPTQFGPDEDYESYPRTLDADADALNNHDVDLLFAPSVETMYGNTEDTTTISVPSLNSILCGASRPGHFDGVTTIVGKLFNLVEPDVAVFGQKDFQQLVIIQTMVRELAFPVVIIGHETQREPDGLALSSRNVYLDAEERQVAPNIYAALNQLVNEVKSGVQTVQMCCDRVAAELGYYGFMVEYVDIRRQSDLKTPKPDDKLLVVLIAAKLGKTRLIDNLLFELE